MPHLFYTEAHNVTIEFQRFTTIVVHLFLSFFYEISSCRQAKYTLLWKRENASKLYENHAA